MKSNIKNESKISLLNTIEILLSIISSCIPIITVVVSMINNKYIYLIITVITAIIALFVYLNRHKISRKFLVFIMNKTAPKRSYKLVSHKLEYEYKSREEMSYIGLYEIKPLRDGLDGIKFRYKWTGTNNHNLNPQPTQSTHKIEKIDNKYGYQRCKLSFGGKSFNKNDECVTAGIKFSSMRDPKHKASPHLATGVYEITDEITLKVIFPMDMNITNIRKLEFIHFTDEEHFRCIKENSPEIIDDKKVITYNIKSPIYGGKYIIDWDFC